jgi:hypothetical protein
MHRTAIPILLFSMLCSSAAVQAAGQIKPGLWEMNMTSDMFKAMPKIPPEQVEKMRQMGISIPQAQDGAMVAKVCISKEMAERDEIPRMNQKEAGCQSKNFQRTGGSYSVDIVCNGADMKGEGKAKGTMTGNDRFNSTYDFKGTAHGQPVNQHHETTGKWLSADCGNVKPMSEFMPKK